MFEYIFVHGLSGWGSYDETYKRMPYWGMRGGDLISFLNEKGYSCHAASVAPTGSAWDRACELYAQIAGTIVDYGKAHSRKFGHERFGKDFSAKPLIKQWDENTKLVLLGHSFGGATIRLFSELLAHGDDEERKETEANELSPLFAGGMEDRIHCIVTIASPMNGTTAYDLFADISFDPSKVKVPGWSKALAYMMSKGTKPVKDGRDERDYAAYDMHIDHAMEMNERISTLKGVYYFSIPCSDTYQDKDGTYKPAKSMEPLFVMRSHQIGAYTGTTAGGVIIDRTWRENDGLVNTVSAMVPHNAPFRQLAEKPEQLSDGKSIDIQPGIWNVFPIVRGDHMYLQGGLMRKHNITGFYADHLKMIDALIE